jgi:hypothetical protein
MNLNNYSDFNFTNMTPNEILKLKYKYKLNAN